MKRTRREKRREARELADHNRAMNLRNEVVKTARRIRDPHDLYRALEGFEGEQRTAMYEALKPHLPFVPHE
jgi:hypothetical protein